jgi:hypothetical protein
VVKVGRVVAVEVSETGEAVRVAVGVQVGGGRVIVAVLVEVGASVAVAVTVAVGVMIGGLGRQRARYSRAKNTPTISRIRKVKNRLMGTPIEPVQ